jgi:hypothetical protein
MRNTDIIKEPEVNLGTHIKVCDHVMILFLFLVYCFTSVRPSKIFFVAFFSVTVDGKNLIFGHKRHIGIPYCG